MDQAWISIHLPECYVTEVKQDKEQIDIYAFSTREGDACPDCQSYSTKIHGRYERQLKDIPSQMKSLVIHLTVRRFTCVNEFCARRTFTEDTSRLASPYARRTKKLTAWLTRIALALGGEAASRLSAYLGVSVSGSTLLRILHSLPMPPLQLPVNAIGIDDWAWRKGDRYGSIICDLERGKVIDVLPDCKRKTVEAWLRIYPSLQIISRDRSVTFSKAIGEAAPQAIQVADRWHILKNVREAVQKVLAGYRACLSFHPAITELPKPHRLPASFPQAAHNRQKRRARYEEVRRLHNRGLTYPAIAEIVGLHEETVGNWIRAGKFPERKQRPVGSKSLEPYLPYIHKRWAEGCHNATQIWREICQQGYDRSANTVRGYVARLRQGLPITAPERTSATPSIRRYTAYQAARLLCARPEKLKPRQVKDLQRIREFHSDIDQAYHLAQRFFIMARTLDVSDFHSWMHDALMSGLTPFNTFATGLHRDRAAVVAGLSLSWNNGLVEGHVNRLKMLKRQMYGRAGFHLLRIRVLYPN